MLNSLHIKNFRALEDFKVSKLGRVNLIVGKNNSGKSSILEALRIYASGASRSLLSELAALHDEPSEQIEEGNAVNEVYPFANFFTGRQLPQHGDGILIGEIDNPASSLTINFGLHVTEQSSTTIDGQTQTKTSRRLLKLGEEALDSQATIVPVLVVMLGQSEIQTIRIGTSKQSIYLDAFTQISLHLFKQAFACAFVPTAFGSMDDLAKLWDRVGLTQDKHIVHQAMRMIAPEFEELMFINSSAKTAAGNSANQRTAIVKLANQQQPAPLKSMGDGMSRILQLSLHMFAAKGGFLLIDEFENGLHYSVQEKVWQMLFEMAEKLDMQVFATTHSWDCVQNFAKVAGQRPVDEGILFRVGRSIRKSDHGKVSATVLNGEQLYNLTKADMEVR